MRAPRASLIIAVLTIHFCGTAGAAALPSPSPNPPPSSVPGLHFDMVVGEKDHVAALHVGQTIEVALHANTGMDNWTQVRSTDQSILVPIVNRAATAMRGVTLAAFKALAPGEAEITAHSNPQCSPGQACPMYVQVWSVKVTVTA